LTKTTEQAEGGEHPEPEEEHLAAPKEVGGATT
jgi:hypothetical protein